MSEFEARLAVGIIMTCSIIAVLVYYFSPVGRPEKITIPDISIPRIGLPDVRFPVGVPVGSSGIPAGSINNLGEVTGSTVSPDGQVTVSPGTVMPSLPPETVVPGKPDIIVDRSLSPRQLAAAQKTLEKITGCTIGAGNCKMRCQSSKECPAGFSCVEGICQCARSLGGRCRRQSDCDCRLGIRCDTVERKCVPANFYYEWYEAQENCPNGARRGYFYDPYIIMEDSTQGDYVSGFRCL